MIQIDVINSSTVLTDDQIKPMIAAVQKATRNEFAEFGAGGRPAQLNQIFKGQTPNPRHWWCAFCDDSDTAGALGYHDLTPEGGPLNKVFAKTDLTYGYEISVTFSHEVFEQIGDPLINLVALTADGRYEFAWENCDGTEADEDAYVIDGVKISNFVTPRYFEDPSPSFSQRYDYRKLVTKPFEIRPGGYLSYRDLMNPSIGWQEKRSAEKPLAGRKPVGSRTDRRRVLSKDWVRSTIFSTEKSQA